MQQHRQIALPGQAADRPVRRKDQAPQVRRGDRITLPDGRVFAVMVGGAGYGAYNIVSAVSGGGGASAEKKSGPPDADEVKETTEAFFAAWEKAS